MPVEPKRAEPKDEYLSSLVFFDLSNRSLLDHLQVYVAGALVDITAIVQSLLALAENPAGFPTISGSTVLADPSVRELLGFAGCEDWCGLGSRLAGKESLPQSLPLTSFVSEILRDFVSCRD